jgi:hypothetical protein
MDKPFGKELLEIDGKTIVNIIAEDLYGYDQGFVLEFSDGSSLSVSIKKSLTHFLEN